MSFTLGYFTSSPFGVPAQQTHQGSRYSSKCRCKIDFVLSVPELDPKRYYSVMLCDAGRQDCLRKSLGLDDAAFRKPTRRRGFPLTRIDAKSNSAPPATLNPFGLFCFLTTK